MTRAMTESSGPCRKHWSRGKPHWLRVGFPRGEVYARVKKDLEGLEVRTVCTSARCPNIFECYSRKTATFLIAGPRCTRSCRFCDVPKGPPRPLDKDEPVRISRAVAGLGLKHVVITSVTRDDLADGGAGHFAAVIRQLKQDHPGCSTEVLVPDFQGLKSSLDLVLEAGPDVLGHNLETIMRLYPQVRPSADYNRSLELLNYSRRNLAQGKVKTGIMVGLGEEDPEVINTLRDIRGAGCEMVTIGQYLSPSSNALPVTRYVHPEVFSSYEQQGISMGLKMLCGPLVRSSYHADQLLDS